MNPFDVLSDHLRGLIAARPPGGALAAGLARIAPDGTETAWLGGRDGPGGPPVVDPHLRLRVASVTKMAVARAAALACSAALDRPLPDWRGRGPAPTLRHCLSHVSGVTDAAGYVVAPPETPEAHVAAHPGALSGHAPGTYFRYANLNYALAGAAMERATGRPLAAVVRDAVLRPAGVGGGLNWWDVADRSRRLAAWRWTGAGHVLEADGPDDDWGAHAVWRGGRGVDAAAWRPGHAAWFSPQGGLRASVVELARLARHCVPTAPRVEWRLDGANGRDGGGLFRAYGLGLTIYDGHPAIPGRLAGHAGHALGVSCGAWRNLSTGTAWAYVLDGWPDLTEGRDDEVFFPDAELVLMRAFAGA